MTIKEIDILFIDFMIPNEVVIRVFESKLDVQVIDLNNVLRKTLQDEHKSSTIELKTYIDNGQVIPANLIDNLVCEELGNVIAEQAILLNYPKNFDQYFSLSKSLQSENIEIQRCWYVKQNDHLEFMQQYQTDNKNWSEKYGKDVVAKWEESYNLRKDRVIEIKKNGKISNWTDLEVNYESMSEDLILYLNEYA